MENPIRMDDLGIPLFLERPSSLGIFFSYGYEGSRIPIWTNQETSVWWVLNFRPFGALEFLFLATFLWDASQDFRDCTGFAVWHLEGRGNLHPPQGMDKTGRPKTKKVSIVGSMYEIYWGCIFAGWWQLKYFFYFHPETWGKMNPFWRSIFSDGLVQPPTSSLFPTQKSAWPRLRFITFLFPEWWKMQRSWKPYWCKFVETIPIGSMGLVYLPTFS